MKLIFKYLKKYFLVVLVIIGITYLQVQTELALPDYMSDIVTNGVQYAGIKENTPLLILEEDMNKVFLFMSENDIETIKANYDLMEKGTSAVISNQEIKFTENTYVYVGNENELDELLQMPLIYSYMSKQMNIDVNKENASIISLNIDESLKGLEDNYSSLVKVGLRTFYNDVGLSIEKLQSNYILHVGLIMLLVSLISVAAQITSTYLATRIASKIACKMRSDVFSKVESFSSSEFSRFSTASLITRTGNDITKVQMLIQMMLRMMLMSPIMGITAVFKVVKYPSISWLLLVALGIMIGVLTILIIFALPKFEIIQKLTDKLNAITRELLDGILVIRAFGSEKHEEDKFNKVNKDLTKTDIFVSKLVNIAMPTMTIVMNGLTVLITWFSAKSIDADVMSIGDMMAFIQYAMHVVMSFMFITMTFFMIPRSLVSAKRIKEVLDTDLSINDIENPLDLPKENGELRFEDVNFKYPGADEYVLENISFSASPGETIAIVGSTGSGKSTIVKLIPRLFDVSSGKITYCGIDIKQLRQEQLRERIGYASQKAVLFSGTIKSNIEFGRDLSDEEINNAIDVSQSRNIINEKEDGINSSINQGGSNVSGGQKQRLSIARALSKKASIYIFDDSFSALDFETDKKLRKELSKMIEKSKSTVIIVAQRISTIKNADKIIVLDEGKIVGIGKHDELLSNCEVYKQIAYSQLSKEELANA